MTGLIECLAFGAMAAAFCYVAIKLDQAGRRIEAARDAKGRDQ